MQTEPQILARRLDLVLISRRKTTRDLEVVNLPRILLQKKYFRLTRKLKYLGNMIPVVVGTLGTVLNGIEKNLG